MSDNNLEMLIIGAGPAGISMGVEAISSGIDASKVVIIEKAPEHSYMIRKFYPEQKLVTANYKGKAAVCSGVMCIPDYSKSETLTYLDQAIEKNQLQVRYEETAWKLEKLEDGDFKVFTDKSEFRTKTCIIAIGMMGKPNKPDYQIPSSIRDKVHFDITSKKIENSKVLVIGGGDSASEYVQYLSQEGNQVDLSYRKDSFSRMNEINQASLFALETRGATKLFLNTNAIGLEEKNGQVQVNFAEQECALRIYDNVVYALGGTSPTNFLKLLKIEFSGTDEPIVKEGFETSVPGLFLIGDLSAGKRGGSIISAFNSSHEAMKKICNDYLTCKI
ncbi:MAG: thioredoxin reductase (NADPH) [Bacteriovoracaceae bacterium]|jgi:thioredoxin reductase (NADPH)